ncbi:hypothetical protein [Clostridium botulinum]|nr:hypothetical protein [Clostridium botulinum]
MSLKKIAAQCKILEAENRRLNMENDFFKKLLYCRDPEHYDSKVSLTS